MKTIQEDIRKGQYHSVYLLTGEEAYLRKDYKGRLLKALLGEGASPNLTRCVGKDVDVREVISTADTLSFFASKRVILLEDVEIPKADQDILADYLKNPSEDAVFIFDMAAMDKRSRLYKAIAKAGHVANFDRLSEAELISWVEKMFKRFEKTIARPDAQALVARIGSDMGLLRMEIEKLMAYVGDRRTITMEDIEEICSISLQDRIFDMFRAITSHDQEKALELYYDLLALKVPVIKILVLLGRQYSQLLRAKDAKKNGYGASELAKRIGVSPYIVKSITATAANYSMEELEDILREVVRTDESIKTGVMEERLALELLIVNLSGGGDKAHE